MKSLFFYIKLTPIQQFVYTDDVTMAVPYLQHFDYQILLTSMKTLLQYQIVSYN